MSDSLSEKSVSVSASLSDMAPSSTFARCGCQSSGGEGWLMRPAQYRKQVVVLLLLSILASAVPAAEVTTTTATTVSIASNKQNLRPGAWRALLDEDLVVDHQPPCPEYHLNSVCVRACAVCRAPCVVLMIKTAHVREATRREVEGTVRIGPSSLDLPPLKVISFLVVLPLCANSPTSTFSLYRWFFFLPLIYATHARAFFTFHQLPPRACAAMRVR